MDKYLQEHKRNIVLIDTILRPLNQGFLNPIRPKRLVGWIVHTWQIWYCSSWLAFYIYLIFGHGKKAGLELISQQIWCSMSVMQLVAKLFNGVFQMRKLQDLFKWCEECYTMKYRPEYVDIVTGVFARTNAYITICIRINTVLIGIGTCAYLFQPIVTGVRETPTQVSINGNDYWPDHIFYMIYLAQFTHGCCVGLGMIGYDNIFIQFTMAMSYRFRTMTELLHLLDYSGERSEAKDRQVLVDIYKMHLKVLE